MGDLPVESEGNYRIFTKIVNQWRSSRAKLSNLLAIPGLWNQVYAALALSVPAFAAGTVEGWPGSMSLKLLERETQDWFNCPRPKSDDCPVKKTDFPSIYFSMLLVALVHMMITGVVMDRLGRKAGCWFILFVAPCGWLIIATCPNVTSLKLGAALIGSIAVSGEVVGVVYLSEVSSDEIRGPLISLVMFFNSLGIFAAHVLGEELHFPTFHYICFGVTMLLPLVLWNLPESPQYLMVKSRVEEARKSVAWFHNNDPATVDSEMKKLETAKKIRLRDCQSMMGNASNRKTIVIATALSVLTELAGTSIVEVFAGATISLVDISPMSSKIASVLLAFCRFIGGILNVYFVERSGRKSTLIVSLLTMATTLTYLSFFLRNAVDSNGIDLPKPIPMHRNATSKLSNFLVLNTIDLDGLNLDIQCDIHFYDIVYFVSELRQLTFYASTTCLVIYTLSNQMFLGTAEVLSGEILPAETKGIMMAVGGFARLTTLLFCVFIYEKALLLDDFAWWNFVFNCVFCWIGARLATHFVPETQGKTLHEIHKELSGDNGIDDHEQDE